VRGLHFQIVTASTPLSAPVIVATRLRKSSAGFALPVAGSYAVGIAFLPDADEADDAAVAVIEAVAAEEGLTVLGWRDVPVTPDLLGVTARSVMPRFRQLFVADANTDGGGGRSGLELDRVAFVLRKRAGREAGVYFLSLSARTLVYKGMPTTGQLEPFFPDLSDRSFASAIGLVHSRFSTNTFPSWPLAHPYRYIAHNGEINTVKGNLFSYDMGVLLLLCGCVGPGLGNPFGPASPQARRAFYGRARTASATTRSCHAMPTLLKTRVRCGSGVRLPRTRSAIGISSSARR
jgi:hypothetical protein